MLNIEKIEADGQILAVVIRKCSQAKGTEFFSPPEFSQQLGLICHKKDYLIKPHIHKIVNRQVSITQEVLHILSGRIELTIYNRNKERVKVVELSESDTVLLANGGHGIKFLEDAKLLEVKQGPYSGVDSDKEHF